MSITFQASNMPEPSSDEMASCAKTASDGSTLASLSIPIRPSSIGEASDKQAAAASLPIPSTNCSKAAKPNESETISCPPKRAAWGERKLAVSRETHRRKLKSNEAYNKRTYTKPKADDEPASIDKEDELGPIYTRQKLVDATEIYLELLFVFHRERLTLHYGESAPGTERPRSVDRPSSIVTQRTNWDL